MSRKRSRLIIKAPMPGAFMLQEIGGGSGIRTHKITLAILVKSSYYTAQERMQVDVNDILRQGEGAITDFTVDGETPELTDVTLSQPLTGSLRIMGTKEGVLVIGELQTTVELECSRCLRTFTHPLELPLRAEFDRHPDEDSFLSLIHI